MRSNNSGFTLIEALVSLALTGIAALLLIPGLKSINALHQDIALHTNIVNRNAHLQNAIQQGISAARLLSALPAVRVHPRGKIVLASGENHAVSDVSTKLRPDVDSNAISFLIGNPAYAGTLIERDISQNQSELTLCLMNDALPGFIEKNEMPSRWLAASPDGAVELDGTPRFATKGTGCDWGKRARGNFSATPNPMFRWQRTAFSDLVADTNEVIARATFIIGVQDSFTLYIDENQNLRRLNHTNTENQPVVYGFKRMEIATTIFEEVITGRFTIEPLDLHGVPSEPFTFSLSWPGERWRDPADLLM